MKIEEMIKQKNSDCCGCEACANICPKNAISMIRDAEGFAYPKINSELCIKCGRCDATCPSLNFHEKLAEKLPKVLLAINLDEKVRRHSSSGGVFSALSDLILNDGGIVFGAGFDENFHVVHTSAENFDEMENLRGSKYVQSQIGDIYRRVKKELSTGRKVLFSGTPCQCVGLKSFLGKDFENLLTMEIFCHGVPAPEIWEQYIDYRGQGNEISRVDFRNKRNGWSAKMPFKITFKNCGSYSKFGNNDAYYQEFLLNTFLRPSCHSCKFRFPNGQGDISIGDAWGIKNFAPEMNDGRGTSLLITHTSKGQNFIDRANLKMSPVDFQIIAAHNPYFLIPSVKDPRREKFFKDFAKSKNAVLTVQKYFLEDRTEIKKANKRQQNELISAAYKKLLTHCSRQREKNLLVFTKVWNESLSSLLEKFLGETIKNFGVFIAGIKSDKKNELHLHCFDTVNASKVHRLAVTEKDLSEFKNDFGITDIFVVNVEDLKVKAISDWIKTCGLPAYALNIK